MQYGEHTNALSSVFLPPALSLHIGKDAVRKGRRELKLVPLSRKAHIWNLTGLLCDVCIAGTLYTAREGGEGRDFEHHSVHVCVKVGSGSLCARASVSSVCVTLSQIVSHHECASVLLLSSPCFRVRKRECTGREGMQWNGGEIGSDGQIIVRKQGEEA